MNTLMLTPAQFSTVAELVYKLAGLSMSENKRQMASARLRRRLKSTGCTDFDTYLNRVVKDKVERLEMLDELTTNETRFYREDRHFQFLREHFWPRAEAPVRVWSAASSTGQEPYTVIMEMLEHTSPAALRDAKLLGTDISPTVLVAASAGRYPKADLTSVPTALQRKYFQPVPGSTDLEVRREVRKRITFARLNLMSEWPMHGPFDLVFLRNVMIYFDTATRKHLGQRMGEIIRPGGYLLIGHSETLGDNVGRLRRIHPSVYQRAPETRR